MNDEISRRLREAAEAHQPDRARMLARTERGAAGATIRHRSPSITWSWPKAALAGLATVGILASGGFAVAGIVGKASPAQTATAPAVPTSAGTSRPAPSTHTTTGPSPTTTPGSSRPTPSTGNRIQNGPLWSKGSVDPHSTVYWTQSNLALKTTRPLTSLTVELRIAQTGGVRNTGNWRTLPSDDFTVTVREAGGALVYRWVLKPGRTVPAGQHEFAAQYNHTTGVRSATDDSYRVDGRTAGGSAAVWGGFAPAH
ncbi:hypothetical protein G3I60_04625 [Streptomyces sp. SID13666]|uniref:hypothetical protein n=1 Tax=unclassified Streptomyces TaxID=2593676 RepID=UPI0013C0EBB5|nr:hypothetical protein [Streptomyces sp. SID13666]NEA69215.1 hypothetical protein [Streptomyces sp. SID13588]